MTRLLTYRPAFERIKDTLATCGPALQTVVMDEEGALSLEGRPFAADAADLDIAWLSADLWMTKAARMYMGALLAAPKLKWLQSAAAGFDNPAFGALVEKGTILTTSHGQAIGIADYVLAGVLDVFQRGRDRRAAQTEIAWRPLPFRELKDSTWLIIGFGSIGQAIAGRAKGFEARIFGVRRNQASDPLADKIVSMEALPGELPKADVVVLCAPLNTSTRHLANVDFFNAMKPGSVLVNVGRGALVDEAALLPALDRGVPDHAVLDVFETEPLPPESPFWTHPRVSLTAHAAGITGAQDGRNQALFLQNLGLYLAGKPLLNVADPKDVLAGA
jgi:phosphoglycerate dehydrogenase-like enzyme